MVVGFALLRSIVLLRKINKTLVVSNEIAKARYDLERDRLALDHPEWYKSGGKMPTPVRKVHFDSADPSEWDRRYKEQNPNAEEENWRP